MTSPSDKSQNISLIIGLSIPIAMIVFVGIAINGPRWFSSVEPPQHNFLYATGQQTPGNTYHVKDGRLTLQEHDLPEGSTTTAQEPWHFFVHNVVENESTEIQLEDALDLMLKSSLRSPDGFSVEAGRRRGGWFIFGYGRSNRHHYLVKDRYSEKLMLETYSGGYNYYWNFRFLGWVSGNE